ncbi:non-ribosomal peptide synthetase/type I polyketide synthase [Nocardia arthritidis]|uniref:Phenyloxazoline synthase MbtB n=1 Tax=Nocardia arthritidis TaxID=228602 RepID=A0A6G9YM60_9NOCA|nr:non-ribosomal peptide synthetase/type I polyketide synthase [Nocardia arthritidis]QIS14116.1 amino acid adenylation domain-containing protein [Nocardia arthritidis]
MTAHTSDTTDLPTEQPDRSDIQDWLITELAERLGKQPAEVDVHTPLTALGISSVEVVELANALSDWLAKPVAPALIWDYPTVAELARQLTEDEFASPRTDHAQANTLEEPIAIVGMACRFPGGVSSPEQLWQLLNAGGDAISEFPTDRGWDLTSLFDDDPDHPRTSYTRQGGFLHQVADFDAAFFEMSPREALATDPQQRLLLELAWETCENAGIDPNSLRGSSTGVYVGISALEHAGTLWNSHAALVEGHRIPGGLGSIVSGRVAYTFGLEGPAITIDTACSSSLVALHLARQALRDGECRAAFVGGVSVLTTPTAFIEISRQRGLSPDGRCKAFAAAADGVGWAEGAGLILVERLSDAQRAGHRVLAVVRGSAVNQDGASNGLSAPRGVAQQKVIGQALTSAGIHPDEVDVVEAHGTGTTLGDPIEAQALLATYGRNRTAGPLLVGSIKSNIGHTQAAAGIAGVLKMVLAMRHDRLPKSLHIDRPTPHVDWTSGTLALLDDSRPWPRNHRPRRAGVSSFGVSGTNAHVILEEPPSTPPRPATGRTAAIPWLLSAKSRAALRAQADRLATWVEENPEPTEDEIARTLATGRARLDYRAAVFGPDRHRLVAELRALALGEPSADVVQGRVSPGEVAFVFPGQGSQWPGMAVELLDIAPVFGDKVAQCDAAFAGLLDFRVEDVLRGAAGAPALERIEVVQPVLFATMVALAELWRSFGVTPSAVVGHSQGEIAAAHVAGALTLPDAARVVAVRSRVLATVAGVGGMASIALPLAEITRRIAELGDGIWIAAVNGPAAVVVTGAMDLLEQLVQDCADAGARTRLLGLGGAGHSPAVEPVRGQLIAGIAGIEPQSCPIQFYSATAGGPIDGAELDAEYWYRNARHAVHFEPAVRSMVQREFRTFVEVSPHPVLSSSVQQTIDDDPTRYAVVASLRRGEGGLDRFARSLAAAHVHGVDVDWRSTAGELVTLPTYAFQRQRFWLPAPQDAGNESATAELDTLIPANERMAALTPQSAAELVKAQAAVVLGHHSSASVDDQLTLKELGFTSLTALELRNRLAAECGVAIEMSSVLGDLTIEGFSEYLARRTGSGEQAGAIEQVRPDPDSRHEPFPLTEIQQAYLIGRGQSYDLGGVATYFYAEFDIPQLDPDRLQEAIRRTIARHDMLRAIVLPDGTQRILEQTEPYVLNASDLSAMDGAEADDFLAAVRAEMSHQVLPTDRWPLFDIRCHRLASGASRVHIGIDLLIADGYSIFLLLRDGVRAYLDASNFASAPGISFRDYVLARSRFEHSEAYATARQYWQNRLGSLPQAPDLPVSRQSTHAGLRYRRREMSLDHAAWQRFRDRAQQFGVTPSALVCTAYAEILGTWSENQHFTLNLTLGERLPLHPDVAELVGDFTSTLLLEVDSCGTDTVAEKARRLHRQLTHDLDHSRYPGVAVQRDLARAAGAPVAMPVVFTSFMDIPLGERDMEMIRRGWDSLVFSASQTPQVYLDHAAIDIGDGLLLAWETPDELFPDGVLDEMFAAYRDLLTAIADGADRLPRTSFAASQFELRERVNDTAAPIPDHLLHSAIAAVAADRPDAPAVIAADSTVSYGELDRRANQIAGRLRNLGARPGMLVAVVMTKGWQQVVATLGVLRSGAAYLPIDASLPRQRVDRLLELGEIALALTRTADDASIAWPDDIRRLVVDDDSAWENVDDSPIEEVAGPEDVAYVIFTSGSTGEPKGVTIQHRAVVNTIADCLARFRITADDRVFGLSSLSFDLSVFDIFATLAAGAALVLPEPAALRDPTRWAEAIRAHGISIWNSVPALFDLLMDYAAERPDALGRSLRLAMLSGDWIPVELPARARKVVPDIEIAGMGGATEASIWSVLYPIGTVDPTWPSIPYGMPMANQTLHILDEDLEPRPEWVPGDLYIGGIGLAHGYWRDPQRTGERFLIHPRTGERLYRTGDRGRYLPDGNIEFLGRVDTQIKIRGFRVELGEIEANLLRHPDIGAAAVTVEGDRRGARQLVAYCVADRDGVDPDRLHEYLGARLPDYMVPAHYVLLDSMPLSPNGKIDRGRLRRAEAEPAATSIPAAGRHEVENLLIRIWREVLAVSAVGRDDDLFQLGGDSLLAMRVVAKARAAGYRIDPAIIFRRGTLAELAATATPDAGGTADQALSVGDVELTPSQLWFLEHDFADAQHWNGFWPLISVPEPLDPAMLEQALYHVLLHHDALRVALHRDENGWRATIADAAAAEDPPFSVVDLSALHGRRLRAAMETMCTAIQGSFRLSRAPMVKLTYFDLGPGRAGRLHLATHWAVMDYYSSRIFFEDLRSAYAQLRDGEEVELPPKTTSLQTYAMRLRERAQAEDLRAELPLWTDPERAEGASLPRDFEHGPNDQASARQLAFIFGPELTEAVTQTLPVQLGIDVTDVLLTAVGRAVTRWTGASSLLVEVEGHGRAQDIAGVDISRTIGRCSTVTPMHLRFAAAQDRREALRSVAEQVRRYPRQGAGYGMLRYLSTDPVVREALTAAPAAQVRFNYWGQANEYLADAVWPFQESPGVLVSPRGHRETVLDVFGATVEGRLILILVYSANLHSPVTIRAVGDYLAAELGALVDDSDGRADIYARPTVVPLTAHPASRAIGLVSGEALRHGARLRRRAGAAIERITRGSDRKATL